MPFEKGQKKKGGRKAGTPNLASIEKRNLVNWLKEQGADRFLMELETLEGKEFCKIYKDVIELAFPKLSRTEVTGKDVGAININFESASDQELKDLVSS